MSQAAEIKEALRRLKAIGLVVTAEEVERLAAQCAGLGGSIMNCVSDLEMAQEGKTLIPPGLLPPTAREILIAKAGLN